MPRFLERRHWTGVVQIRLKMRQTVHYFDCVIHAMMRGEQVNGMTILARDITASRRNEARFTELFETLQEGIYIVTPEDQIVDANPALVRLLGYDSKSELLAKKSLRFFRTIPCASWCVKKSIVNRCSKAARSPCCARTAFSSLA